MRSLEHRLLVCVLALLMAAGAAAAADLASAKRAYDRKDYASAFKQLLPMAKQGNAKAEFMLARMYLMGQGVLKDRSEAMKLFNASAVQGNADAQFFLGSLYLLPHVNIAEGLKWTRLSAEQGNQDAQLLLGKAYMDGNSGVPRDPVKADMWLRLAAKNNLPFYELQLAAAERQMNAGQIAKGKALAAAWKPKHGLRPGNNP